MISGHAIATLVVFLISNFFVIHPVTIPTRLRRIPLISLNLTTAPILAIAILWAAQSIHPDVIRNGIVGTEGVKPYNILIFFFSLAYIFITLDITGILQAVAFWVGNKGGRNGWRLYLYFYVMLTFLSILPGSDFLSSTTFLVYCTGSAELNPWAWVMAQFSAVNTANMVLFVGSPTNVVICEGFDLHNAAFTAYTILPFLACNLSCFVALTFQYRNQVPRKLYRVINWDPRSAFLDPVGAWVGSFMLGAMLILCLVISIFGIDVWMISLPFAIAKLVCDLGWDHYRFTHGISIFGGRLQKPIGKPYEQPTVDGDQMVENPSTDQRLEDTLPYPPSFDEERPQSSLSRAGSVVQSSLPPAMIELKAPPSLKTGTTMSWISRLLRSRNPILTDTKRSPSFPLDEITAVESHTERARIESKTEPQTLSDSEPDTEIPHVLRWHRSYMDEITSFSQRPEDTSPYPPSLDEEKPRSSSSRAGSVVRSYPETTEIELVTLPPLNGGPKMSSVSSQQSSRISPHTDTRQLPSFPLDEETAVGSLSTALKIESKAGPQPLSTPEANIKSPYDFFRWIRSYIDNLHARLHKHFVTLITALPRLPFALIPFALSQFILVEALERHGWVDVFAGWLVRASRKELHPTIWLIGVIGIILCNLSGTIGATILLTKVVHAAGLPYHANRAAAIALVVASNIGSVGFTLSASLGALAWRDALSKKGIYVRQRDFALWNLFPLLVMTTVGLGIVSAEMAVLSKS